MIEYAMPVQVRNVEIDVNTRANNTSVRIKLKFTEKPDKKYLANIVNKKTKLLVLDEYGKHEFDSELFYNSSRSAIIDIPQVDDDALNYLWNLQYDKNVDPYLVVKTLEKDVVDL